MFDTVNDKVSEIAGEVGQTPLAWNSGVYFMIRGLSGGGLYVFLYGGFLLPWRSYRGQNQHLFKHKMGAQLLGSSEGRAPALIY